jgi:hypothetical protein
MALASVAPMQADPGAVLQDPDRPASISRVVEKSSQGKKYHELTPVRADESPHHKAVHLGAEMICHDVAIRPMVSQLKCYGPLARPNCRRRVLSVSSAWHT